jgi:hypothetical protein
MRMVFDGIEIVRAKDAERDGARVSNADSFAKCAEHLAAGGELIFFPEGTSELGPRHLKFRSGVGMLIKSTLEKIPSLKVVPLAAHYEGPTEWQSDVDIAVGPALEFRGSPEVAEIMTQVRAALEAVGLDCETAEERREVEALAYAATLGQDIPYSRALKILHAHPVDGYAALEQQAALQGLQSHQGIPLVPIQRAWLYPVALVVLGAITGADSILNRPVYLTGELAARKLADAPNVVSMWRALAGIGAALVWVPVFSALLWSTLGLSWAAAYLALSYLALKSTRRFNKVRISVHNLFRASDKTRQLLLELHFKVVSHVREHL